MVATAAELTTAIEDFVRRLTDGIRVEAIVLYGSYSNGAPGEWSDIDVAVISPDFEGLPANKRQEIISDLTLDRDRRISPLGYASGEYRDPRPGTFLDEILRTGKVVYEAPAEE